MALTGVGCDPERAGRERSSMTAGSRKGGSAKEVVEGREDKLRSDRRREECQGRGNSVC